MLYKKKRTALYSGKYMLIVLNGIALLVVVAVFLTMQYSKQIQNLIRQQAEINLMYVSNQNAHALKSLLESREDFLRALAADIEQQQNYDVEQLLQRFSSYVEQYDLYNMGVTGRDGICYTTRGETLDLSDQDYVIKGFEGEFTVSDMRLSEDTMDYINVFTMPVYKDGQVELLITAPYKSEKFAQMLDIVSFEGEGHSIVIDKEGRQVAGNQGDFAEGVESEAKEDITGTANSKGHYIYFSMGDGSYVGYVERLDVNNWYLLTYVNRSYMQANAASFVLNIQKDRLLVVSVMAAFCVFFGVYCSIQARSNEKMLFVDPLTNSYNYEYLKLRFEEQNLEGQQGLALMVMDIDKLKLVNMLHGMQMGDKAILYVYHAFKRVLSQDEIYRRHADEFIALIRYKTNAELVAKLKALNNEIQRGVQLVEICPLNVSMGVCPVEPYGSFRNIYGNAILAKNEIKGVTHHCYCIFDERMSEKFLQRGRIEAEFAQAIQNDEFQVWYQPKYALDTGRIVGAEALVRWKKSDGQMVSPGNFIPVFEQNGQIIRLDEHVINLVCKDIKEMKAEGFPVVPISVNLSRLHLHHPGIVHQIDRLAREYNIVQGELAIEITESAMLDANDSLNSLIDQLHERGYRVDMDDYGSGVSSIGSLASLPFDTIKMDKSFVDHIGDERMNVVIRSTIQMALELDLEIVAEGIETKEQADFLRENHCTIGQGYYFSRPLDKSHYKDELRKYGNGGGGTLPVPRVKRQNRGYKNGPQWSGQSHYKTDGTLSTHSGKIAVF